MCAGRTTSSLSCSNHPADIKLLRREIADSCALFNWAHDNGRSPVLCRTCSTRLGYRNSSPNLSRMATSARLLQRVAFLSLATALFVTVSSAADEPRYEHGISFFHELKYPADFTHFDYINPDAPKGGVLVLSTQRDFNTLTMFTDFVPAPATVRLMYDSLVSFRTQEMGSFYGRLADGLSVSDDKRTLFIRLHPEARWHDGAPITTRDVKFTLDLLESIIRFRAVFSWLQSVEILSEREIAFRLASELTLSNFASLVFPIMAAHYWEDKDPTLEPPLGSGPYRIAEVRQGRHIRFERVPDYWGRDIPVNKGRLTSIRSATMFIGMRPSPGRRFARDCSIPGARGTFATGRQGMTFLPGIRAGW